MIDPVREQSFSSQVISAKHTLYFLKLLKFQKIEYPYFFMFCLRAEILIISLFDLFTYSAEITCKAGFIISKVVSQYLSDIMHWGRQNPKRKVRLALI